MCRDKDVLDLGGTSGLFVDACSEAGARSVTSIDRCPQSPKVIKYDVLKYFRDTKKKFDVVYARHMLEHFSAAGVVTMMKGAARCLRKGGIFVIVIPNMNNLAVAMGEFWREFEHVRPYTATGVRQNLELLGFVVRRISPDKDSWDNKWFKNIVRRLRSAVVGIPYEAPDIYIIAEKK